MDMKERLQELAEAARKRIEESDGPDKLMEGRGMCRIYFV